jgi:hypothetical protein
MVCHFIYQQNNNNSEWTDRLGQEKEGQMYFVEGGFWKGLCVGVSPKSQSILIAFAFVLWLDLYI